MGMWMRFLAESSGLSIEVQSRPHSYPQVPDSHPSCPGGLFSEAASPRGREEPTGVQQWWWSLQPLFTGTKTRNRPAFGNQGLLKPALVP